MTQENTALSRFAQTNTSHARRNSTADRLLKENPGTTLGELLSDHAIASLFGRSVASVRSLREMGIKIPKGILELLHLDFAHLQEIGRLPPKFKDFNLQEEFPLD